MEPLLDTTTTTEFDPLNSDNSFDPEIINAAKKREIKNILKSYVGQFDTFSELIQNAMDAVDRRSLLFPDTSYKKKLWIRIDIPANQLSITDNGIGFNEKEFRAFLAPNISFKEGSQTRGSKGVGATYLAYGFNFIQLGSKSPGFRYVGNLESGNKWLEDNLGIVTRPIVRSSNCLDANFEAVDRGSTFTLRFDGQTRPKNLSWFAATTPEQWLFLLLLKTPLGTVKLDDNATYDTFFDLTVIDSQGNSQTLVDQTAKYLLPHNILSRSCDLKEIIKVQKHLNEKAIDISRLPAKYEKLIGIYEFFSTDEILELPSQKLQGREELINNFKITAYCYFSYSTSIWSEFNDNHAKLRKGYRVLRGGLQLANNGMIQGDLITIPLTSNIGYQNQAHILVQFVNADPDLGRKGFQPELKELSEDISVAIVNRLKRWKKQLRKDTGSEPIITPEIELYRWIREQENYEISHPLILSNPNFFMPINEISISSYPRSEQDVIVLFNQLIAGGVIRGIKLMATSQHAQYDSLFKFSSMGMEDNYLFDKVKNPLGVERLGIPVGESSPPKVLEYKYSVDGLITEFNNEEKNEKDLNLVVAWKLGNEWKKSYTITSLLDLDNVHHRIFHGITHILEAHNNNKFYAIILEELLEYLQDIDRSQSFQKDKYGDIFFLD